MIAQPTEQLIGEFKQHRVLLGLSWLEPKTESHMYLPPAQQTGVVPFHLDHDRPVTAKADRWRGERDKRRISCEINGFRNHLGQKRVQDRGLLLNNDANLGGTHCTNGQI